MITNTNIKKFENANTVSVQIKNLNQTFLKVLYEHNSEKSVVETMKNYQHILLTDVVDNVRVNLLKYTFFTMLFVNQNDNSNHINVTICHNHFSRTYEGVLKKTDGNL